MTIIKRSVSLNEPPLNWKGDLQAIRQTPDYRAIVQEHEATLSQLEEEAGNAEILRLFEQLGGDKLPN